MQGNVARIINPCTKPQSLNPMQKLIAYERVLLKYNLPLDPTELQKVLAANKDLLYKPRTAEELFNTFLYTLETDVAGNSHDTYQRAYKSYLQAENTFDEDGVRRFIRAEQEKGNKISTINTKLAALRSCAAWAFAKNYIPNDFMKFVKQIPDVRKVRDKVKVDIDKVFNDIDNTCRKPWIAARNKAMFMIFMSTGCRVSEFINIKLDNLSMENGKIKLTETKGGEERFSYYPNDCTALIADYLRLRDEQSGIESPYLFISDSQSKDGSYRLTRQGAYYIVTRYTERSGNKVGCHKLRSWCADTHVNDGGTELRVAQAIMGHKQISTTQIYVTLEEDTKKNATNSVMAGRFPTKNL